MNIFIIIPVYNNIKYTVNCIASIYKQTYKKIKIIIIDDGSTDDTYKIIKNRFPEVILLKGNGNLWWAGSMNLGVEYVIKKAKKDDFILSLNNDLVVKENYLENLLKCYIKNKPCLVGSLAVDIVNPIKIIFAGVKWNRITAKYKRMYTDISTINNLPKTIISDLLPGRGILIPVEVFKKIGFYDNKHFPQYAADEDFSFRAKKAGYKLIICRDAVIYSYVKNTGANFKIQKPTLNLFLHSLSSIKSANNLKVRYYFAKKNSKLWLFYFICDVIRIVMSFMREYILYYIKRK